MVKSDAAGKTALGNEAELADHELVELALVQMLGCASVESVLAAHLLGCQLHLYCSTLLPRAWKRLGKSKHKKTRAEVQKLLELRVKAG